MFDIPLQLVDSFLMDYHIGHALFLGFVLVSAGSFAVKRSVPLLGIIFTMFGLLFILTPSTMMPTTFLFLGVALVVAGPVIAISAE